MTNLFRNQNPVPANPEENERGLQQGASRFQLAQNEIVSGDSVISSERGSFKRSDNVSHNSMSSQNSRQSIRIDLPGKTLETPNQKNHKDEFNMLAGSSKLEGLKRVKNQSRVKQARLKPNQKIEDLAMAKPKKNLANLNSSKQLCYFFQVETDQNLPQEEFKAKLQEMMKVIQDHMKIGNRIPSIRLNYLDHENKKNYMIQTQEHDVAISFEKAAISNPDHLSPHDVRFLFSE